MNYLTSSRTKGGSFCSSFCLCGKSKNKTNGALVCIHVRLCVFYIAGLNATMYRLRIYYIFCPMLTWFWPKLASDIALLSLRFLLRAVVGENPVVSSVLCPRILTVSLFSENIEDNKFMRVFLFGWCSGSMLEALDSGSTGCGFESRFRKQPTLSL